MKQYMFVFAALVGVLLIGCADQSSVNAPEVSTATLPQVTDGGVTSFSSIPVDEVVVDEKTGQRFSVQGTIDANFSKDETSYTLVTVASLTVASVPDGKDHNASIFANTVDQGPFEGEFDITKSYKLGGFPPNSQLRITLHVGDPVTLQGMNIALGGDAIGIEAD
jgi:hypothetical protein